jgi:tetratricopeptide (TPR) repeat protein
MLVAMPWLLLLLQLAAPQAAPSQARAHLVQGDALLRAERFGEAIDEFRAALRLDQLLVMAHYGLGQAHMAQREYRSAVVAFRGARDAYAELDGRRMQVELALQASELQRRMGAMQYPKATEGSVETGPQLDDRVGEDPTKANVRPVRTPAPLSLALGSAHFRAGDLPDAELAYRGAIAADPGLGEAHNNLAVVLLLTGRAEEAGQELRLARAAGFRVAQALEDDVAKALARSLPPPR